MKKANFASSYLSHQQKLKEAMRAAAADARKQRERRESLKPETTKDAKAG